MDLEKRVKILCVSQMLGYNKIPFNPCYKCTCDIDKRNKPNNLDCSYYKPVKIYTFNVKK